MQENIVSCTVYLGPSELSVIGTCHIIQVTILLRRMSLRLSELSVIERCHIIR